MAQKPRSTTRSASRADSQRGSAPPASKRAASKAGSGPAAAPARRAAEAAGAATDAMASTASRAAASVDAALGKLGKAMQGSSPLGALAPALIEGHRRNLEAVVEANRVSYEGMQKITRRQAETLKKAVEDYQKALATARDVEPSERLKTLDAAARSAFRMALDNLAEMTELAAQSQADAYSVIRKRVRESVSEARKLLG